MSKDVDFAKQVELWYPSLYRFAFTLAQNESDAADLTQQTFLILAQKGDAIADPSKVKSWLFTTLHREFLGKLRRITRFPELEIEQAAPELPDIPPPDPASLDLGTVLASLKSLDPAYNGPLALFYLEDYSYPEISAILGIPLGTVKSRISRGIAQLQEKLTPASSGSGRIR